MFNSTFVYWCVCLSLHVHFKHIFYLQKHKSLVLEIWTNWTVALCKLDGVELLPSISTRTFVVCYCSSDTLSFVILSM